MCSGDTENTFYWSHLFHRAEENFIAGPVVNFELHVDVLMKDRHDSSVKSHASHIFNYSERDIEVGNTSSLR